MADSVRGIADFEAGWPPGMEEKLFAGRTSYQRVPEAGGFVLEARSRGTASGLMFPVTYDPADWPRLAWRWKIEAVVPEGDGASRARDDYAARVYVIFPHWLPFKTCSLVYIWATGVPAGTRVPNPYTANAMMIVLRSGPGGAGVWQEEVVDVAADFRRAFGRPAPEAGAVAVMTDTDNTGGAARAWYDDFRLLR